MWDEPNLSSGWGGREPSPVRYAALLQAAYEAIHAVDADALVLTAGLAPTVERAGEPERRAVPARAVRQRRAPILRRVAGKPCGFDDGPLRRTHENVLNFSPGAAARVMVEHGDAGKPLWASHFGWNALPEGWQGVPSAWGQTTPAQQAAWTLDAYRRALTEWPWAGALILENWQSAAGPDDPRWGFALRGQNGSLSPTAEAIRAEAAAINGSLWPGVYAADVPLAEYEGEWEFSELGADIGQQGDSVVTVPFTGSSLGVIARRDNYRAYLYVTVDGEPPGVLPHDERGAYAVLTSPDYQPRIEVLPLADGLEGDERHVARIEAGAAAQTLRFCVKTWTDRTTFGGQLSCIAAI